MKTSNRTLSVERPNEKPSLRALQSLKQKQSQQFYFEQSVDQQRERYNSTMFYGNNLIDNQVPAYHNMDTSNIDTTVMNMGQIQNIQPDFTHNVNPNVNANYAYYKHPAFPRSPLESISNQQLQNRKKLRLQSCEANNFHYQPNNYQDTTYVNNNAYNYNNGFYTMPTSPQGQFNYFDFPQSPDMTTYSNTYNNYDQSMYSQMNYPNYVQEQVQVQVPQEVQQQAFYNNQSIDIGFYESYQDPNVNVELNQEIEEKKMETMDWLEKDDTEEKGVQQEVHDFYCNCQECLEKYYGKESESKNINVAVKKGKSVTQKDTKDSDNNSVESGKMSKEYDKSLDIIFSTKFPIFTNF